MYDCYNEAVRYLKEKLGTKEVKLGWGTKNHPYKVNILYLVDNIIPNSDEHLIHLLLTQYYYGIDAQKELYYKLVSMGILPEKKLKTNGKDKQNTTQR